MHNLASFAAAPFYNKILAVALFSMAGVPPFTGFFTKLFIFLALTHQPFAIFFFLFFLLLFLGLYFYMQQVRFLISSKSSSATPSHTRTMTTSLLYPHLVIPLTALLIGGWWLFDDLLLLLYWLGF